jgi:hypothetical protein
MESKTLSTAELLKFSDKELENILKAVYMPNLDNSSVSSWRNWEETTKTSRSDHNTVPHGHCETSS